MRIGSVERLVEIAISRSFGKELKYIREAMLISGDISQVAVLAKKLASQCNNEAIRASKLYVSRCYVYYRRDNKLL